MFFSRAAGGSTKYNEKQKSVMSPLRCTLVDMTNKGKTTQGYPIGVAL